MLRTFGRAKVLIIVATVMILSGCEKSQYDDFYYLRYKGADMPVVVRGNIPSGVFIIYMHGGPGGSTYPERAYEMLSATEEKFAMVYYDQRASGNSQGKTKASQINIDQYIEDLEVLIAQLNDRYAPEHIILMGHSWGGTLGTAFLLKEGNQEKVDGWIEVDGGHNLGKEAYEMSREYVITHAQSVIASGAASEEEVEEWQEITSYYDGVETWDDPLFVIGHSGNVGRSNGYFHDPGNEEGLIDAGLIFGSENNMIAYFLQNLNVILHMDIWHLDYTSRLSEIEIPVLIAWGRHDGILPVELGIQAKETMNLPDENFVIFEHSAHIPQIEETALFNEEVITFIERTLTEK
jgi:pimeloyl-ACP methyl ester carboxylesterase